MKFKFSELATQFFAQKIDSRLKVIALVLDAFCTTNFGKEILVTQIFRTIAEQRRLYNISDNIPDIEVLKTSPHLWGRALDIRSHYSPGVPYWTEDQIKKMEAYINTLFPYSKAGLQTLKLHCIPGGAYHFHMQVDPRMATLESWGFFNEKTKNTSLLSSA